MSTIYQVSELAGVSLSSVSRVMNNHKHVSEKTKSKVLSAIAELEYRPNFTARSLASNCSNSVGVLVAEISGPFYSDLLCGVESQLSRANKHAVIISGGCDEQKEKEAIQFLIDRNCDALILCVDFVSDQYLINLTNDSTTNVVIINRYIEKIADNCIFIDNILGSYQATEYLIKNGHKKIAYLAGPLNKADAKDRFTGYQKALNAHKISLDKALTFEADYTTVGGRAGMLSLIRSNKPFTAVVCANDEMASAAMRVARENRLRVPQDCSIMGFDNVYFSEYLYPQLSTIEYPINKMAKMAVQWVLKNAYNKKKVTIKHKFHTELIIRESTQFCAITT